MALNFPATHEVHDPPSGPVYPLLQLQSDNALLAAGDAEFAGHSSHVLSLVAPSDVEYLPLPHATQSPSLLLPVVDAYLPAPHA